MVERTDKHNQMTQDDAASNEIRRVVDQAVSLVLRSFFPQLQAKIVAEVLETLPPAAAQSSAPTDSAAIDSYALVQAVAGIQAGSSQKEILRALLDAGSAY
jgi:hypothetical protein